VVTTDRLALEAILREAMSARATREPAYVIGRIHALAEMAIRGWLPACECGRAINGAEHDCDVRTVRMDGESMMPTEEEQSE
jgi:hypothetical protein